jgi:dTDP-glucose pyrophosphorylase
MNEGGQGFLAIADEGKIVGVVTDGDFRRAIIENPDLDLDVSTIMNVNFIFVEAGYHQHEVDRIFSTTKIRHLPVLLNAKLVSVIFKVEQGKDDTKAAIPGIPVVIMAGGKGTRLEPFTRILPKPLIPIGDQPVIELIMAEFAKHGMTSFYISINHKGSMIRAYFDGTPCNYDIKYIQEEHPLGTAGSLKFLEGAFSEPFFVTNCDILIYTDYRKIFQFHKEKNYDLTLIASMQRHTVPYGVCKIQNESDLLEIMEKPQYDFVVNTGMYLLEPHVIKYIPEGAFFNITDLIAQLIKHNLKVGCYAIPEDAWVDIGQWADYRRVISKLNLT